MHGLFGEGGGEGIHRRMKNNFVTHLPLPILLLILRGLEIRGRLVRGGLFLLVLLLVVVAGGLVGLGVDGFISTIVVLLVCRSTLVIVILIVLVGIIILSIVVSSSVLPLVVIVLIRRPA